MPWLPYNLLTIYTEGRDRPELAKHQAHDDKP